MWFIYLLRVSKTQALYCGITNDLEGRMAAHRKGTGAKYLRGKSFELVWFMSVEGRSLASRYEYRVKQLAKSEKEALVNQAPLPLQLQFSEDK